MGPSLRRHRLPGKHRNLDPIGLSAAVPGCQAAQVEHSLQSQVKKLDLRRDFDAVTAVYGGDGQAAAGVQKPGVGLTSLEFVHGQAGGQTSGGWHSGQVLRKCFDFFSRAPPREQAA